LELISDVHGTSFEFFVQALFFFDLSVRAFVCHTVILKKFFFLSNIFNNLDRSEVECRGRLAPIGKRVGEAGQQSEQKFKEHDRQRQLKMTRCRKAIA
jgi:hypothetical protein